MYRETEHQDELSVRVPGGYLAGDATFTVDEEWRAEDDSPYCECGRRRCVHTSMVAVCESVEVDEFSITNIMFCPRTPDDGLTDQPDRPATPEEIAEWMPAFRKAAEEYALDSADDNPPTMRDFEDHYFDPPF